MHEASAFQTVDISSLLHIAWPSPSLLRVSILVGLLPVVIRFDLRERRIPDWSVGAAFVGAGVSAVTDAIGPTAILAAFGAGLGAPLAARAATGGSLGWGDVKLCVAAALLVGPRAAVRAQVAASVLAAAGIGLARVVRRDRSAGEGGVPFGPYLVASTLAVLVLEGGYGR